jgi:predicted nucleic acid-binding Zn ribbon protein
MPIYTFKDKKTGKEFDEMMTIAEMEDYLSKNKHITQVLKGLNIISGVSGVSFKNDGGWKDNLSRIAEAHPNSPLAERYGKKTTKEIKTKQALEKNRRRLRGKK